MEALAVLLLALLGCSLRTDGMIVSKCTLRDQLQAAVADLSLVRGNTARTDQDLVTKFVCLAEKLTGFNTSALNEVSGGTLDQNHSGQGGPGPVDAHNNQTSLPPPPDNTNNQTSLPPSVVSRMCYGIFQLSNRLSCNDSVNSTYNICNMTCSQLRDDDITDDINCLLTFFKRPATTDFVPPPIYMILTRLHVIFLPECTEAEYSEYFVDCPPPPN